MSVLETIVCVVSPVDEASVILVQRWVDFLGAGALDLEGPDYDVCVATSAAVIYI
jgi:hypothetical protein